MPLLLNCTKKRHLFFLSVKGFLLGNVETFTNKIKLPGTLEDIIYIFIHNIFETEKGGFRYEI